jgi:O-antigen ligase
VLGVGPGHFLLHYQAGDGRGPLLARYAHNEYVQTLAVLGVVGLAVLLAAGAGTAAALRRARRGPSDLRWAGVVAGLSAFAVHSSLDFLWHVPALPLVAAVLLGSALPQPSPDPSTTTSKETS